MDLSAIFTGVAIGAVVAGIGGYFGFVMDTKTRVAKVEKDAESLNKKVDCIDDLQKQVSALQAHNDVFWKVLEPHLAAIIHSPTHKRRDLLVDKLVSCEITYEETKELEILLAEAVLENKDESKKLAAALLLARARSILLSAQRNSKSGGLKNNDPLRTDCDDKENPTMQGSVANLEETSGC